MSCIQLSFFNLNILFCNLIFHIDIFVDISIITVKSRTIFFYCGVAIASRKRIHWARRFLFEKGGYKAE